MAEKIPPVKTEKPIQTPEVAQKQSSLNKILIPVLLVLLVAIVVLVGTIIFLFKRFTTVPLTTTQPATNVTTASKSAEATPNTTVLINSSIYKNEKYGFEISYSAPYRALDDATNLYGYPNGVVLLYQGGQAYDVVIEVWNTKAAYESNYSSRMSDVTVVESNGKFITLLNNTQSPDNEKIIASFKLLSY